MDKQELNQAIKELNSIMDDFLHATEKIHKKSENIMQQSLKEIDKQQTKKLQNIISLI